MLSCGVVIWFALSEGLDVSFGLSERLSMSFVMCLLRYLFDGCIEAILPEVDSGGAPIYPA